MVPHAARADVHSDLASVFTTNEADVEADVNSLQQYLLGAVCSECSFSNPAQQHNRSEDSGNVFNCDSYFANPIENFLGDLGYDSRIYFIDEITSRLGNGDPLNSVFAAIMQDNFQNLQSTYKNFYGDIVSDYSQYYNTTLLSGGGGFGFGVQIDCNSTTLITVGGGIGSGWQGSLANMTGGGGGGAGMQAFFPNGTEILSIGGGGGGGIAMSSDNVFSPSWGTTSDSNQVVNPTVFQSLSPIVTQCFQAGGLVVKYSGGGGAGVVATYGNGTVMLQYGAGWGFAYTLASPNGSGNDNATVVGSNLGMATTQCRQQCLPSQSAPGNQFYGCFCPCVKNAFLAVPGNPWAQNINCNLPQ